MTAVRPETEEAPSLHRLLEEVHCRQRVLQRQFGYAGSMGPSRYGPGRDPAEQWESEGKHLQVPQ